MDHTIVLIQKSHEGDKEARARLVEENTGLVWCVVKRFYNRGVEMEDLFQIGTIGLLKAIDKFDDGMIKVSRSLKELSYKAYLCREKLQERFGREPSVTELAGELGVEPEELMAALDASSEVESLHKPIYQSDGQEVSLMDRLPWRAEPEEAVLDHLLLKELLGGLEKEERQLIYLRYFADRTQAQAGKELGISQVQVSRLEKKILKSMREQI